MSMGSGFRPILLSEYSRKRSNLTFSKQFSKQILLVDT
jgi:hypothetical protein